MNQSTLNSTQHHPYKGNSLKIAVVSSCWHRAIVEKAINAMSSHFENEGFSNDDLSFFEVPGAFELPLHVKILANTGKFDAIIACGFVVNGGIYRHDFVASAVIDGLMQVQLTSDVPVFSAVLTPHSFHDHSDHIDFFANHFTKKGAEVAQACIQTIASLRSVTQSCV